MLPISEYLVYKVQQNCIENAICFQVDFLRVLNLLNIQELFFLCPLNNPFLSSNPTEPRHRNPFSLSRLFLSITFPIKFCFCFGYCFNLRYIDSLYSCSCLFVFYTSPDFTLAQVFMTICLTKIRICSQKEEEQTIAVCTLLVSIALIQSSTVIFASTGERDVKKVKIRNL